MNELIKMHYSFIDDFITEKSNDKVVFRIPDGLTIRIDKQALMQRFDEIRSIDLGFWANGDQDIVIYFKQNELHESGLYMIYR